MIPNPGSVIPPNWKTLHLLLPFGRKTKYCNYIYNTQKQGFSFANEISCISVGEKAPAGAFPVAPSLESTCFMYLQDNRDSLFINYRRLVLGGKKALAGAHLVAPSLKSSCFVYLSHKSRESLFIKYRRCFFGGKKPLRERTWPHQA